MWGEIFRERKPMEIYPDKPLGNVLQVAMPRAPRLYVPGGTMHVVARRNNPEVYFLTAKQWIEKTRAIGLAIRPERYGQYDRQ